VLSFGESKDFHLLRWGSSGYEITQSVGTDIGFVHFPSEL
jgi:hypothetical protein